jgi:hypothetical protein
MKNNAFDFDIALAAPGERALEQLGREIYDAPIGAFPPSVSEYISFANRPFGLDGRRFREMKSEAEIQVRWQLPELQ